MFSGATGNGVFLPFQQYARPQHLGAGVLAQQRLRDFQFSGLGVLEGGQRTLIGAIEYNFRQRIRATGSGGWLNSQRYAQGQVVLQPFRSVSFYGNHSSYFDPFTATGNSVGASLTIARFTGIAGWNEGTSRGIRTTGQNIGAGFRLKWISEQSTLYKTSKGQTLLVHSVTEMMRRWSFTEAINQSAGRNSYSFGASFRSNRFSISAGHTVQFLLGGRGYAQVLGISVSFRLPHDTTVSASTISNPITGKTLWNVGGEEYIQAGNLILPGHETHSTGKHLIAGHCVLEDGTPQEGCAVVIGKEFVYSNSHGEFQSHQTKKTACVTVPADEFSAPGRWQIVETPNSTAEEGSLIRVVVRKM